MGRVLGVEVRHWEAGIGCQGLCSLRGRGCPGLGMSIPGSRLLGRPWHIPVLNGGIAPEREIIPGAIWAPEDLGLKDLLDDHE